MHRLTIKTSSDDNGHNLDQDTSLQRTLERLNLQ